MSVVKEMLSILLMKGSEEAWTITLIQRTYEKQNTNRGNSATDFSLF